MSNHQINQQAEIYGHSRPRDHVSIAIQEMLTSMPETLPKQCIFRVLHQPRQVNEKAYEPVILAIGPYHHGNEKFKFMEEQKKRYLQQLLERRNEIVDSYMPTLMELEQEARDCYAETIDLPPEKFLAMMLIDGCFIIEFFRKHIANKLTAKDDPLMHDIGIQNSIRRDLLLLENQLPLFVLTKLYDLTKGRGDQSEFGRHASQYFEVPIQNWTIREGTKHLLHLYHTWRTSGLPETLQQECKPVRFSATELRELGVKFRAAKGDKLSYIKFENGTLEIPVLEVKHDTESEFRNLVAFEQHRPRIHVNYFTNYIHFMDCLINSSKDITVLRHARIIENHLRHDEVIAQMFNRMGDCITVSSSCYSHIFKNLNEHCDKRISVWMVKLRREYFHSPWAFLSVLAAIVLLLLAAAQTVFTILSYTKQS